MTRFNIYPKQLKLIRRLKTMKCEITLFPCDLSPTKWCNKGGNKSYNYGFVSGTAGYCFLSKKWISDMKECPKKEGSHDTGN